MEGRPYEEYVRHVEQRYSESVRAKKDSSPDTTRVV